MATPNKTRKVQAENHISDCVSSDELNFACIGGGSDEDDIETEVEDDSTDEEDSSYSEEYFICQAMNNSVILSRMFELCSPKDLATFRKVSTFWQQLSLPYWRSSVTLTINADDLRGPYGKEFFWEPPCELTTHCTPDPAYKSNPAGYRTLLQKLLCYVEESTHECAAKPYRKFCLKEWEMWDGAGTRRFAKDHDIQVGSFVRICGPYITALELNECYYQDVTGFRNVVFQWFPNLKILELRCFVSRQEIKTPVEPQKLTKPLLTPRKGLTHLEIDLDHQQLPITWMEMFGMLPNINTLKLFNVDVDETLHLVLGAIKIIRKHYPQRLQIKNLDILSASMYAQDRIPDHIFMNLREVNLPLKSLTIDFGIDTKPEKVKDILQCYAGTFEKLNIYRGTISRPYDNFPFQVELANLQELVISDRMSTSLAFLKCMPNLKKIHICDIEETCPIVNTGILQNTKEEEIAGLLLEKCRDLRFDYGITSIDVEKLIKIMPHIEKLRMPLGTTTFQSVCSGWSKTLRDLEILENFLDDSAFTGLSKVSVDAFNRKGNFVEESPFQPNIRNLIKLSRFTMANNYQPTSLSDCSVYHGLLQLPNLHFVCLTAQITDSAVEALQIKVSNCNIIKRWGDSFLSSESDY